MHESNQGRFEIAALLVVAAIAVLTMSFFATWRCAPGGNRALVREELRALNDALDLAEAGSAASDDDRDFPWVFEQLYAAPVREGRPPAFEFSLDRVVILGPGPDRIAASRAEILDPSVDKYYLDFLGSIYETLWDPDGDGIIIFALGSDGAPGGGDDVFPE